MITTNACPFGTLKKTARIAGIFYLMYILTPILAQLFAQLGFGDAAEIINLMKSNSRLFRLGSVFSVSDFTL